MIASACSPGEGPESIPLPTSADTTTTSTAATATATHHHDRADDHPDPAEVRSDHPSHDRRRVAHHRRRPVGCHVRAGMGERREPRLHADRPGDQGLRHAGRRIRPRNRRRQRRQRLRVARHRHRDDRAEPISPPPRRTSPTSSRRSPTVGTPTSPTSGPTACRAGALGPPGCARSSRWRCTPTPVRSPCSRAAPGSPTTCRTRNRPPADPAGFARQPAGRPPSSFASGFRGTASPEILTQTVWWSIRTSRAWPRSTP